MSIINTQFDDIYSVAYKVIDSAAASRNLVKLYKGSHISEQPHEAVFKFLAHFAVSQEGLLSFIDKHSGQLSLSVNPDKILQRLYQAEAKNNECYEDFRSCILTRKHKLGHYRGGSSGYASESKAAICEYFDQFELKFDIDNINIYSGGIKGAFMCFCAALFSSRSYDDIHILGGSFLMPIGYYQSLRNIPSLFKCQINTLDIYNENSIKQWIKATRNIKRRAIYIPTVNNADGLVLPAKSMRSIIKHVIEENLQGRQLLIFWDDVYRGSYIGKDCYGVNPEFKVRIRGKDYSASDYSVIATSPSKTYALPTSRVCFIATTNTELYSAMEHYQILMSFGRVSQIDELCALVAMLCTPSEWVTRNNKIYESNLKYLQNAVADINTQYGHGKSLITLIRPEGGWYFIMKISKQCTDWEVGHSIEFLNVLLTYSGKARSGIACLPGELFGYTAADEYIYRCTLAVSKPTMDEFIARLTEIMKLLSSSKRQKILDNCSRGLNEIVNVEKLMENTRY